MTNPRPKMYVPKGMHLSPTQGGASSAVSAEERSLTAVIQGGLAFLRAQFLREWGMLLEVPGMWLFGRRRQSIGQGEPYSKDNTDNDQRGSGDCQKSSF
mmetsp:Transcript_54153/g.162166  ORF Transcript_54153/g.162166 Transcript_54153/m.162166 type:complete len:99 (-) Transcript_54153:156-452(-)